MSECQSDRGEWGEICPDCGQRLQAGKNLVGATRPRLTGPDLRERRLDAEVRQDDLALRLGVTRQRVSAIEAAANPSRQATRRYLEALADLETAR